jgi:hypothetical protein
MSEIEFYINIRNEIVTNHVLMHVLTFMVVVMVFAGVWIAEYRTTMLSVFLPLLSVAWAAAILRFDFFIHRQGAYLRHVEASFTERGMVIPFWESWKASLYSTKFVTPFTDFLIFLSVIAPTIYLLFGPARTVFRERSWRSHSIYAWSTLVILILLLLTLPFVPIMASR